MTSIDTISIHVYNGSSGIIGGIGGTWVSIDFGIWLTSIDNLIYHDTKFVECYTDTVIIGLFSNNTVDYEFYLDYGLD